MFKALLRTRIQATLAGMFRGRRAGRRRSRMGMAGYGLLMLYVGACFLYLFYMMAGQLCAPLVSAGLDWLYFALTGTMAVALSVVGSVFAAQTQLFEAKDNELLLSMPIPPSYILGSRMAALYGQSFLFSAVVLLPSLAVYLQEASPTPLAVVFAVCIFFLLPVLSLSLSCILGWLVALISSRMRRKSLITLILSLGFLAAYFYLYFKMSEYLQLLVLNSQAVGETIRRALFPLYQMGQAAQGDALAFLWFALCVALPFAAVYFALARTFLKIATTKRGAAKIRYRERTLKVSSQDRALLGKELRRFWSSPTYMLNGALGSVLLLAGAVAAVIKRQDLVMLLGAFPVVSEWTAVFACGVICLVLSMNLITAPSVSLEGKSIWLAQSMPVRGWQVLRAKLLLHMLLTAPPALICSAVLAAVLHLTPAGAVLTVVIPQVFSLLCAALGLALNLLLPRLDWISEAQAVKQSGSAVLALFADWGTVLVLVVLGIFLMEPLGKEGYLGVCAAVMALAAWALCAWLKRRGAERFVRL